jgi:hypothetical protein
MHIYSRQIILGMLVPPLVGCAPVPSPNQSEIQSCEKGKMCTVSGNIFVYRGSPASVAELKTSDGCFAVSLTPEDYTRYHKIRGGRVRVTGISYDQDAADGVVSYRLRDRDVATGICSSGLVIYATRLETLKAR